MSPSELALDPTALYEAHTQHGDNLERLSERQPQLVVFLRHSGCTFCKQTLDDLSKNRQTIAAAGVGIVLVHMQNDADAASLFARYGLADVPRISDPERKLYRAFDLKQGSTWQVAGPDVWLPGLGALLTGHVPGIPSADVFQMPGTFLVHHGKIVRAFRSRTSAERPDYCEIAGAAPAGAAS
jgi:peroxiredoxin